MVKRNIGRAEVYEHYCDLSWDSSFSFSAGSALRMKVLVVKLSGEEVVIMSEDTRGSDYYHRHEGSDDFDRSIYDREEEPALEIVPISQPESRLDYLRRVMPRVGGLGLAEREGYYHNLLVEKSSRDNFRRLALFHFGHLLNHQIDYSQIDNIITNAVAIKGIRIVR